MDEWVGVEQLDLSTMELDSGDSAEGIGRTRNQKRKLEETTCVEGEGHGNFDPHQLREHEEFTKVKNVETIELGKFAMDTWYFSPLPEEYRDCKVAPASRLPCYFIFCLKAGSLQAGHPNSQCKK